MTSSSIQKAVLVTALASSLLLLSSCSQFLGLFGLGGQVASPAFSPSGGTYSSAQTVAMSDVTGGATIYYTTDGSTPSTSSKQYTAPLSVSSAETIKAYAVRSGMSDSAVTTAIYAFQSISLDLSSMSILASGSHQLTATVTPASSSSPQVTWTSADPNVATVSSSGLVSGVAAGVTTITASVSGGASATVSVSVWQSGGGYLEFKAADPAYYGWDWWFLPPTQTAQGAGASPLATVVVQKSSGASDMGYGVTFCYQDGDDFYVALINVNGWYSVYKRVNGTYSAVVAWVQAPTGAIAVGYNTPNTIGISEPTAGNFTLSDNGTQIASWSDSSFTSGSAGFYVTIGTSPDESFPSAPEDILFNMTAPITYN